MSSWFVCTSFGSQTCPAKSCPDNVQIDTVLLFTFYLHQVCERALFSLKLLHDQQAPALGLSEPTFLSPLPYSLNLEALTLEEAKLHWERGERTYAMALLKKLLDSLKTVSMCNQCQ